MDIRISINVDGLLWGDLIAFADHGRWVDPGRLVDTVDDEDNNVTAFELEVGGLINQLPPLVMDREIAESWAGMIERILEEDGDARSMLGDLRQLRDELRNRS